MLKMVKGSESSDFDCYRYLDDMGVPYIYFILIFLLHSLQLLAQVAKPIPHIVNLLVIPLRIYTHKSTFAHWSDSDKVIPKPKIRANL